MLTFSQAFIRKVQNFGLLFNNAAEKGILLLIAAVIALAFANSTSADFYKHILYIPLVLEVGDFSLSMSLSHFINDFLMAIFFFLVGMEIKREMICGHLSTAKQRILPFVGAVGGVVVPVGIYLMFTFNDPESLRGWAIPSATDIAFALGMLALFGKGLPTSVRVFLTALAILDDLFAVVIIAIFYTENIAMEYAGFIVLVIFILAIFNRNDVLSPMVYVVFGLVLWYLFYKSGIHGTIAGVVLGFLIPLNTRYNFSPLRLFEEALHPYVSFFILPLFAFANAGITFKGGGINLLDPVTLGCFLGLFLGKQIGVFFSCFAMFKTKISSLPSGTTMGQFYGVCTLCGIGFTMSLFIGLLAFENNALYLDEAKFGILLGSFCSAIAGAVVMRVFSPKPILSKPII